MGWLLTLERAPDVWAIAAPPRPRVRTAAPVRMRWLVFMSFTGSGTDRPLHLVVARAREHDALTLIIDRIGRCRNGSKRATSIDALSVGFTIAEYDWLMALVCSLIIAAVTLCICLGGLVLGRKFGMRLAGRAQILGGAILIFIGLEIFISSML